MSRLRLIIATTLATTALGVGLYVYWLTSRVEHLTAANAAQSAQIDTLRETAKAQSKRLVSERKAASDAQRVERKAASDAKAAVRRLSRELEEVRNEACLDFVLPSAVIDSLPK